MTSVFKAVFCQALLVTVIATVIIILYELTNVKLGISQTFTDVFGIVISLLLAYRMSAPNERYWEGVSIRYMSILSWVYVDEDYGFFQDLKLLISNFRYFFDEKLPNDIELADKHQRGERENSNDITINVLNENLVKLNDCSSNLEKFMKNSQPIAYLSRISAEIEELFGYDPNDVDIDELCSKENDQPSLKQSNTADDSIKENEQPKQKSKLSYSQWTFKKIYKLYNIDEEKNSLLFLFPLLKCKYVDLNDEKSQAAIKNLVKELNSQYKAIPIKNEASRCLYVSSYLVAVSDLTNNKLQICPKKTFSGPNGHGPLDYALTTFTSSKIIEAVEVKLSDYLQGIVQNTVQCKSILANRKKPFSKSLLIPRTDFS
ncbi:2629_t:CDS:2 [Gigaspora margarita]|uniref:2629_t:CDS:1 n=1 Tax=Gigaspora margarita TaxID=4874 RepID=A0ABM8W3T3_GIGMA|nr:2629_t:CDS:2 [Gigaspora margarita]